MAELKPKGGGPPAESLELRQRLWQLAGAPFRGRKSELAQLGAFAATAAPRSMVKALFKPASSVALAISGPGGAGKSALLARFLLEQAKAHRLPFVYLDFTDARIAVDEPLTLLVEAMRQLGSEYPEVRASCERLRTAWLQQAALEISLNTELRAAAIRELADILRRVTLGKLPILFALDSFEELQSAGDAAVDLCWQTLEALHAQLAALRVIVAGRIWIDRPGVQQLPLAAFDEESAIAFLQACRIDHTETAQQLFRDFGGSPLALQLAVAHANHKDEPQDSDIQRLYRCMLGHIRDARVRTLAQLGFVLRRLTPELIHRALAEPSGVTVDSLEHAQRLFAQLQSDIHLFEADGDGLRPREALRQLVLAGLRRDAGDRARRIDEAAVRFYADQAGDRERAEEIYHRLWLGQTAADIDARWHTGVTSHLINALLEQDAPHRELLAARLGTHQGTHQDVQQPDETSQALAEQLQHASTADPATHGNRAPKLE